MRVCYLDCLEFGLCCYLVIHVENLLYSCHLLCFHLWTVYWLSLVRVNYFPTLPCPSHPPSFDYITN
jgi:membrane-associated PAP2 superfamily phosphatase